MKVLITGFTGTLGTALIRKLIRVPGVEITGLSRDELKQANFAESIQSDFHLKHITPVPRLHMMLGDVSDPDMSRATGYDAIVHLAALKRVDRMEYEPWQCVRTNIIGTQNVLYAAAVTGAKFILASTDKAVAPINVYGMSKGIAEKSVLNYCNGTVIRYGNVMASRGSVIPQFVKTLQESQPRVEITHPDMTRFWVYSNTIVDFFMEKILGDSCPGLHIPTMRAAKVADVAAAIASILDVPEYVTNIVGVRPGEKLHEMLDYNLCSADENVQMTPDELHEFLLPLIEEIV